MRASFMSALVAVSVFAFSSAQAQPTPVPTGTPPSSIARGFITGATVLGLAPPDATQRAKILNCFNTGNCEATAGVNLYPIPCSGSGGALCSGCWRFQNKNWVRVGNFSTMTGTVPSLNPATLCGPGEVMVYVGYRMECPTGAPTCTNGRVIMGCDFKSVDAVNGAWMYDKQCFGDSGVIRDVSNTTVITATPSPGPTTPPDCPAGRYESPAGSGTCVPCAAGTYKSVQGNGACTACPNPPTPPIANAISQTFTTVPASGATSYNDCKASSLTCAAGYVSASGGQWGLYCDPVAPPTPTPTFPVPPTPTPSPSPPAPPPKCNAVTFSCPSGTLFFHIPTLAVQHMTMNGCSITSPLPRNTCQGDLLDGTGNLHTYFAGCYSGCSPGAFSGNMSCFDPAVPSAIYVRSPQNCLTP